MIRRSTLVGLALVASLSGLLLTAGNRWGAGDPGLCRDTFGATVAACAAPQSPWWALLLGALLPAAAVLTVGVVRHRRSP